MKCTDWEPKLIQDRVVGIARSKVLFEDGKIKAISNRAVQWEGEMNLNEFKEQIKKELNLCRQLAGRGRQLDLYPWYSLSEALILPEGLEVIETSSIRDESYVKIPDSVKRIGLCAFRECSLNELFIPKNVTEIEFPIQVDNELTSISVSEENPVYDSREDCNAVIETRTDTLCVGCVNTIIPESITTIGPFAFWLCDCLVSISLPPRLRAIEDSAFEHSGLSSIHIPECVETIGECAFAQCYYLREIILPESVKSIGENAFENCFNMEKVIIPNSVEVIRPGVFRDCSGLTCVVSKIENPYPVDIFENDTMQKCTLYVPKGTAHKYRKTKGWQFRRIIEGEPDC